jgi:hypothetical protein
MFLIRNFARFIELGLIPAHIGGTPEQIQAFSPHLYEYISHLQVAVSAFIIALGHLGLIYLDALILLVGAALAWRGLQR